MIILNPKNTKLENEANKSSKNTSDVIDRVNKIKSQESLIRTSDNIEKRG